MTGPEVTMRLHEQIKRVRAHRLQADLAEKAYQRTYAAALDELLETHAEIVATYHRTTKARDAEEKRLREMLTGAARDAPELFTGSACLVAPGLSVRKLEKVSVTDDAALRVWAMEQHPEFLIVDLGRLKDWLEGTGESPPGTEKITYHQGVLAKVI